MGDDHAYAPDVVIARLTPGECVACRFKERRRLPFVDDDTIGSRFDLCFIDFEAAGDNTVSRSAVGAFDAVFSCPGCGPPPPPTATPPPLPRQTPRKKGMSGGAIAAICGATLAGGAAAGRLRRRVSARGNCRRAGAVTHRDPDARVTSTSFDDVLRPVTPRLTEEPS